MDVKNYDREIFVGASGAYLSNNEENTVRLEFFALSADNEGNMKQESLTNLKREIPYRGKPYIISTAVGDFDGDKHNNEIAVMINTRQDILFSFTG